MNSMWLKFHLTVTVFKINCRKNLTGPQVNYYVVPKILICTQRLDNRCKGRNTWHILKKFFEQKTRHFKTFVKFSIAFLRIIFKPQTLLFVLQSQFLPSPARKMKTVFALLWFQTRLKQIVQSNTKKKKNRQNRTVLQLSAAIITQNTDVQEKKKRFSFLSSSIQFSFELLQLLQKYSCKVSFHYQNYLLLSRHTLRENFSASS